MAEVAQTGREIKDFQGLTLDTDPHDLQDGSTNFQVNCTSEDQGILRSRHGYALCIFEGELPFARPVNHKPLPPADDDPIQFPPYKPFEGYRGPVLWEETDPEEDQINGPIEAQGDESPTLYSPTGTGRCQYHPRNDCPWG